MTQWIGDKWRLKAGPQLGPTNSNEPAEGTAAESNPEPQRCGYKESFVQEYDGIKVYHHQGSYQHIGPQIYSWAFYEYRMVINSECWNIIIDENMGRGMGSPIPCVQQGEVDPRGSGGTLNSSIAQGSC